MAEPTNDVLLVHLEYIKKACDQTNAHLVTLNGRVDTAENRLTVIETRGDDAKTAGAKWGGAVGGIVAGATIVYQFFQGVK